MLIVVVGLGFLSGFDVELKVFLDCLEEIEAIFGSRTMTTNSGGQETRPRVISMQGKEGCLTSGGVDGIVVTELSHREEVRPIVLLIV